MDDAAVPAINSTAHRARWGRPVPEPGNEDTLHLAISMGLCVCAFVSVCVSVCVFPLEGGRSFLRKYSDFRSDFCPIFLGLP